MSYAFPRCRCAMLVGTPLSLCNSSLRRTAVCGLHCRFSVCYHNLFTSIRAHGSIHKANDKKKNNNNNTGGSLHSTANKMSTSSHVDMDNNDATTTSTVHRGVNRNTTVSNVHSPLLPLEMFFQIVSPRIATAPCVTRIGSLYSNLPPVLEEAVESTKPIPHGVPRETHRWIRHQFGTITSGLQQLYLTNKTSHWGVYISEDQLFVVKASCEEEAKEAFAAVLAVRASGPLCETESLFEVFQPVFPCFKPPPPLSLSSSSSSSSSQPLGRSMGNKSAKKYISDTVFTPQMLVPYVPTYFIPMSALLTVLPDGYTAEHIERIFAATGTLEIVTLEGEQFVRLHGGKRLVDFTREAAGEAAHIRWREFQPDPFLCEAFRRLLPPSPRWASLRTLINQAPSSLLQALLPWKNYKTILYFAQMQHVFSFTPAGEGEVCWLGNVTCLSFHDSPTPAVVSELVGILTGQRICIADLLNPHIPRISDHAKMQIILYYGTLVKFFHVHGDVFYLNDDDGVVGLVSEGKNTAEKTTHTLEEKLEDALVKKDRRTAQKLRRRLALEKDPDNPYADREVLLDAVLRYVPQHRSISLHFLLKSLPPSLTDFLPSKPISLFQQAPEKVRLFEYRYRHRMHLIRPGVPLPQGVLRQKYTEEELLFLCAAELQQQPRVASDLYGRLPYGAKEIIRLQYKGLVQLLQRYPQYFTVVFKDSVRMDSRSALVTLLQMPKGVQLSEEDYGAMAPQTPEEQRQLEEEDRAAIQTLPEEIQQTMRLTEAE
ncbi:uncharacterized protein TM35_000291720 [Trypanosoma theileri]|uniref:Uncharacterized protein n=1 Tax=Trypanosoma theileri TaxID=67003 RepID=A0A1X0NQ80_9TRYP|nr:uncharacterized protein TM35_000291720 [Trypanosoma theileri]ORC86290.1 hypothetical protein TM35_000291720 [Trypanosoma theileri]